MITASHTETSPTAQRLAAEYKARQARFAAAARKAARKPSAPPPVILIERNATVIRIEHSHSWHIRLWHKWKSDQGNVGKAHILRRCEELGVTYEEIVGKVKKRDIAAARQLLMWEVKTLIKPDASYPEVGRLFGNRDHTTVLHAVRKIQAQKAMGT